jgi:hypothetical protein
MSQNSTPAEFFYYTAFPHRVAAPLPGLEVLARFSLGPDGAVVREFALVVPRAESRARDDEDLTYPLDPSQPDLLALSGAPRKYRDQIGLCVTEILADFGVVAARWAGALRDLAPADDQTLTVLFQATISLRSVVSSTTGVDLRILTGQARETLVSYSWYNDKGEYEPQSDAATQVRSTTTGFALWEPKITLLAERFDAPLREFVWHAVAQIYDLKASFRGWVA